MLRQSAATTEALTPRACALQQEYSTGELERIEEEKKKNITQPIGYIGHMFPGLPSKFSQVFQPAGGLPFAQVSHQEREDKLANVE